MKPGGNLTSTFLVRAPSRSFGTRTAMVVKPPEGSAFGCTVTCAEASAGSASAAAAAAARAWRRFMSVLSDRNVDRRFVLVEAAEADLEAERPGAGHGKADAVEREVAGAGV